MPTLSPILRRNEVAPRAPDTLIYRERIEELVRLLTAEVTNAEGRIPGSQQESSQEIILDTDVDGSRFLLVRFPKATRSGTSLSPREHEIVRMVAEGHPNKIIADVLNISSWTVCTHLRRIFAKLGVNSRAAMVAHLLEIETPNSKPPPHRHPAPAQCAATAAGLPPTRYPAPLSRNPRVD